MRISLVETIEVDLDKPRRLLLTTTGLQAAQKSLNNSRNTELDIFEIIEQETNKGKFNLDFVNAIIWASMLHEDPDVSPDIVGKFIPWTSAIQIALVLMGGSLPRLTENNQSLDGEKKNLIPNGIANSGHSLE